MFWVSLFESVADHLHGLPAALDPTTKRDVEQGDEGSSDHNERRNGDDQEQNVEYVHWGLLIWSSIIGDENIAKA
jgi:hypothetical protein